MSIIMNELNNQGYFRVRISKESMEECVFNFLIEKCKAESFIDNNLLEGSNIEDFFADNIGLGINYNDDVCITFCTRLEKLENQLRLDNLITEDISFRATNLCIKAIEHDLGIESKKIDVWRDNSFDYMVIQLPSQIIK